MEKICAVFFSSFLKMKIEIQMKNLTTFHKNTELNNWEKKENFFLCTELPISERVFSRHSIICLRALPHAHFVYSK